MYSTGAPFWGKEKEGWERVQEGSEFDDRVGTGIRIILGGKRKKGRGRKERGRG